MKDYKPRYEELYKYYQVWLTDFTKLTVRSGMCHQNIYHHHTLTVGSLKFPGEEEVIAIVPQCLHRIIYGRAAAPLTVNDDLSVSLFTQEHLLAHHPMLEGVLLSECVRLKQRPLANKLISLFRQFGGIEWTEDHHYHAHVVFWLDGSKTQNTYPWAQQAGLYWCI